jgi:RecB family exonuclease
VLDRFVERAPGSTLADHVDLVSTLDYEADVLLTVDEGDGVAIATLHQAKGTEYDAVYIADAVEGTLPDLRTTDSLLGVRHLNPHLPTVTSDYVTFRLDEERRLAYTAMTRSTARVVWTATVPSEGGDGTRPSRFMSLVAPTSAAHRSDDPLTPRAYRAHLRRLASDPEAPLVDRLAAISVLADGDLAGSDPLDRYGVRSRGPDVGIVPEALRLSPSKAHAYEQCPRRFAFEQFLMRNVEESVHMRFGSLLHRVLERSERRAMEAGEPRGTIEVACEELDELWDDQAFGGGAVAAAWRNRAVTLLTNLYEGWPSSGTPVALEVDLPLTIDGTEWLGRADRIESSGWSLRIVDYKTGNAAKLDEAAVSIQLGYYLLAAASHELRSRGAIDGAEFWYPKQANKHTIATRSFDVEQLDAVRSRLVGIGASIASEDFPATVGDACRTCPVATSCPARPEGVGAFA